MTLVTQPAPIVDPLAVFDFYQDHQVTYWSEPSGTTYVAVGSATRIAAVGEDRFRSIEAEAQTLWNILDLESHPSCQPPKPKLFGGFSFDVPQSRDPLWDGYPDGLLTLPRLVYEVKGGSATIGVVSGGIEPEISDSPEILNHLGEMSGREWYQPERIEVADSVHGPSKSDWAEIVGDIVSGIRSGNFEKVVAASRTVVELRETISVAQVLSRLSKTYPDCYRFAMRLPRTEGADSKRFSTFLGATPERLIAKSGMAVKTEALAGSIPASSVRGNGLDDLEIVEKLLSSQKDHHEHEFVIQQVYQALGNRCELVENPAQPIVRRLANVHHLQTPISGRLKQPTHILRLLDDLHPTPAAGGTPTRAAMEWIAEHEPGHRGWYASPVGWVDPDGDGEFATAIRSAVVDGHTATLFAGAGIVAGSQAETEFEEIRAKFVPLLDALGVGA